jgi:hypothetical protein
LGNTTLLIDRFICHYTETTVDDMGLLNLPPELFAKVIRLCVDKDNVREVSKQRSTCSEFSRSASHLRAS